MAQPQQSSGLIQSPLGQQIVEAISFGEALLLVGELGSGIEQWPEAIAAHFGSTLRVAIAVYKGSVKLWLQTVAKAWDIPIDDGDDEKPRSLGVDQLWGEIGLNVSDRHLLIVPEAQRLPASVRYRLLDVLGGGCRIVALAPMNPGRDFYLELLEIELPLPSEAEVRAAMQAEAQRLGLALERSQFAALEPIAGRNPKLARRAIQRRRLGLEQQQEHRQYVVIMPILIALLFSFAVVRFVGLGTNNRGLYITGGICLVVAMALKQLGQVKGARKRLGQ
ncbi:hypothetical protein ACN4EG_21105 [Alkalinema pantanalense CENA528]|uniref:hypothetical protein n=1 Tax=Alkalinema pantanalense TaxID=1620705 RepID=UPI003D6E2F43